MNKKTTIWIIVAIIIIATILGTIATFVLSKNKNKPEDIWQKYIACINEQKYEEMYNMLTEDSKAKISQDDFISRNKNIYDGIDMTDMQIKISSVEEENSTTSKISYNQSMNSEAGKIEFENTANVIKDKELGYQLNWKSSLIFPNLSSTDKVRIKTISAERGSIVDKNGNMLAGLGTVSSVGIVPGKLGENKDENIEKIANLLGTTADSINKTLSASWVKDDTFVPLKKIQVDSIELKEQLLQIPGIKITSTKSRVYPLGEASAHLVGYVQNITADELKANRGKGYTSTSVIGKAGLEKQYEETKKEVMEIVKKELRPEFINRIDEIIVFHKLEDKEIYQIIDLMLKGVQDRLKNEKYNITIDESVKKFIAKKGIDKNFGARPLRRTIQNLVEDKLAEFILNGKINKNESKTIYEKEENLVIRRLVFLGTDSKNTHKKIFLY